MADEEKGDSNPMEVVYLVAGIIILLVVFWIANGGPSRADVKGLFIAPLPPVGSGESYGPQIGEPSPYGPNDNYYFQDY